MNSNISDTINVKVSKPTRFATNTNMQNFLRRCEYLWSNLDSFRRMRERSKRFMYGDQLSEPVVYNGKKMTEQQYLELRGLPALKNNKINQSVRSVISTRRQQNKMPICTAVDSGEESYGSIMSELLRKVLKMSNSNEKDSREFEEFCISGLASYKVSYTYRRGKENVFVDEVNPKRIFFPQGERFDMRDIDIIGEIHDLDFSDVLMKFSHSDGDDLRLREIYKCAQDSDLVNTAYRETFMKDREHSMSFYMPQEYGKCRVIEVWSKERKKAWFCHDRMKADPYIIEYNEIGDIKRENERRIDMNRVRDTQGNYVFDEAGNYVTYIPEQELELIEYERRIVEVWYYRYLSPLGHVLEEGVSPYREGDEYFHPYVIKPFPYIDGEIHSYVAQHIDQQRFLNHYIMMIDFIIKNGAKGALVVDENSLSESQSIEDVLEQYSRTDGLILWNSQKSGQPPHTLSNTTNLSGIQYMIELQNSIFRDASGVQPAMMGANTSSNSSGYLYQQQVAQSQTSIFDLLESYNSFLLEVAQKIVKCIKIFYNERKYIVISGERMYYDPVTMGNVEYDLTISDNVDSPVYRAINNELVMNLLNMKLITLDVALKAGAIPNSEKLLNLIEQERAKTQQQLAYAEQQQNAIQSQIDEQTPLQ